MCCLSVQTKHSVTSSCVVGAHILFHQPFSDLFNNVNVTILKLFALTADNKWDEKIVPKVNCSGSQAFDAIF